MSEDTIKELIYESATDSTAHSIPHMFKRENKGLKLLWFICFLAAFGVCTWMISMSISDYFQFETISKTEIILEIPSKFPTVSICNMNSFVTNYSLQFVQDILVKNGLYNPSNKESFFDNFTADTFLTYKYFAGINAMSPNLTDQDRKRMGFDLNDILISCTFDLVKCNASDFEWYYDIFYGSYYEFNSGRNSNGQEIADRISTKAGKINGLNIEMYVGDPTDPLALSTSNGVHITVHNKSARPYFFDGFDLPAGLHGNVAISRKFVSLLEQPYSDCVQDVTSHPSILVQSIIQSGYSYRQTDCFGVCYLRNLIQACGCYDLTSSFPLLNSNNRPCLNFSDVLCDGNAYADFFSQDVKALCSTDCPLECDSVVYSISNSFAQYPSATYAETLKNNPVLESFFGYNQSAITYDQLRRRVVSFSVFYTQLNYNRFTQLQKTALIDLVSSVGGTLGLFLGMSFLSFIEIVDLLIRVTRTLIKRN